MFVTALDVPPVHRIRSPEALSVGSVLLFVRGDGVTDDALLTTGLMMQ